MKYLAFERLVKKLTIENLWLYILTLLKREPVYAYDIYRRLKEEFNISPSVITVYVVLYKMKREGLVKVITKNNVPNAERRKYYVITEKGLETLEKGKRFIEELYSMLFGQGLS